MSKKFPSIYINKSRRTASKQSLDEDSRNKQEITPQCSKKFAEKFVQERKSARKFKGNAKGQQKDKNNLKNLEASENDDQEIDCLLKNIKHLDMEESSTECIHRKQSREKANSIDSRSEEIKEQSFKQKKKEHDMIGRKKKLKEKKAQQQECEGNKVAKQSKPKKNKTFPEYVPIETLEEYLKNQDATNIQYVEGYLRINYRWYKHAYLLLPNDQHDLLIIGLRDRNRALEGDLVIASVNPPDKWQKLPEGKMQKTGVIVCIKEKVHSRRTIGHLKQEPAGIMLYPRDRRVPLIKICPESLPKYYTTQIDAYQDTLFLANITKWRVPQFAFGEITERVGSTGDILAESYAILLEHNLDITPYSQEAIEGLPDCDYVITEDVIKDREDWRQECVFTIDPDTAVDLDDAVSCKLLDNGNCEIGVHISDVTHYLEFLSPLDIQVAKRATTIYMTDNVYHMLPKQLCQVCSLLPGKDKLAFSVIWEMTPDAKIVKHRFAKTVIRSCCQMAYKHAQKFIENPGSDWLENLLNIHGNYTVNDLSVKVNILHKLASLMRNERFENGALQINQPKLHVTIDKVTGLPISYSMEEQKDSNRLIEEFMLLANMTVASHLYHTIPDTALLRNHRESPKRILREIKDILQKFGVYLDIESVGQLQASIARYEKVLECEPNEIKATLNYRMMVINNLCSKAMTRATYKCSSTVKAEEELKHYALNVSFYTHFTSPIRRYSDCVVHRLLYSTVRNIELPEEWTRKLCIEIADNCNIKKYSAKLAQEESSELYFTYLIELHGPLITMGIVLAVRDNSIDVILCQVGIKLRVYLAELTDLAAIEYSSECSVPTISISWKQPVVTQVINVFALLYLRIEKHPELFRLIGVLLPPNPLTESQ